MCENETHKWPHVQSWLFLFHLIWATCRIYRFSPSVSFVTCQEVLLKGIQQIVDTNINVEPLHFLTFPIILGASTPGGVSTCTRQNGAAGGKSVGLLWKGKLSPGRREGDTEYRPSHLCSSPWHAAPLHLPLVGQNCWPHMASGFSASMWLWVTEQEKKDGDKDKGETQEQHPFMPEEHKHELVLRFRSDCLPEEGNPPAAESHHGSSQAGMRLMEDGLIHILSMGSKALMLQVWANFSTGSLTFRYIFSANCGLCV